MSRSLNYKFLILVLLIRKSKAPWRRKRNEGWSGWVLPRGSGNWRAYRVLKKKSYYILFLNKNPISLTQKISYPGMLFIINQNFSCVFPKMNFFQIVEISHPGRLLFTQWFYLATGGTYHHLLKNHISKK